MTPDVKRHRRQLPASYARCNGSECVVTGNVEWEARSTARNAAASGLASFSYTAKSDFQGQDSFTIQVSGMLNGIRGSSDIRIIVSVGPKQLPPLQR
jgi:hypothetical protein